MIIRNTTNVWTLVVQNRRAFLLIILIGLLVDVLCRYIDLTRKAFSFGSIGFLVTALSIFLAFRISEAYQRWWEARKLWGGIVNLSRTFGRRTTHFLNPGNAARVYSERELHQIRQEMIYRQIAYVNALRLSLRQEDTWEDPAPFLPPDEMQALLDKQDKPTEIMQRQADQITRLHRDELINNFQHLQLEDALKELVDLQGGCERIKNTHFPERVAFLTKTSAWIAAVLIPLAITDPIEMTYDVAETLLVLIMMSVFVFVEIMGDELKNPFENRPNDTPMTSICRTIEISLREQLGETDLPPKTRPKDGVLM